MQQGRQGFTLLELMMVVVIIGILATIALPQYFRSAERARVAEATSILGTIRASELRYKAQSAGNTYTTTLAELDVEMPATMNAWETPTVVGTGATSNATLTRKAGAPCAGQKIEIDLDEGKLCGSVTSSCNDMWGVAAAPC